MKIYTLEEVAEILKVTTHAVKKYIAEGKIKTIKNMGSIRVTEENLKSFIRGE